MMSQPTKSRWRSDPGPSEIVTGLYVGSERDARENSSSFDLVVNCTPHVPYYTAAHHVRLAVQDDPFDAPKLYDALQRGTSQDVLARIHDCLRNEEQVLVHCQAGAQRSAAVAACYLVAHTGLTTQEAVEQVRCQRPIAFFFGVNLIDTIRAVEAATVESK